MYYFYMGKVLLPVAPKKLELKIKNQNKTYNMINGGEMNLLKEPGLTEISFDLLLPNVPYPFAQYPGNSFRGAKYYLDRLEKWKKNRNYFPFIVTRDYPNGDRMFDTNVVCSLEDYNIIEDKDTYGLDIGVSITLKQFAPRGSIICKRKKVKGKWVLVVPSKGRATKKVTTNQKYIIKKGDTLLTIAKRFYGDSSKYYLIIKANLSIINPSLIKVGQIIIIPPDIN